MAATATVELRREERRFTAGGICLGIGFGGFVDGIVLHQVLQWHHLLTSTGDHPAGTVAGLEANTLADGLFHAATWVAAFAGVLLVTAAMRAGYRAAAPHQLGLVVAGWGAFNLVEGTIDHQILGIHHVRAGDAQWAYDLGFLAFGAVLLLAGLAVARRGQQESRRHSGFPPP
jgi:uncharacterized membrane protein